MLYEVWDWFVTPTIVPEYNRSPRKGVTINDPKTGSVAGSRRNSVIDDQDGLGKDIEHFLYQTGLQGVIYGYNTND